MSLAIRFMRTCTRVCRDFDYFRVSLYNAFVMSAADIDIVVGVDGDARRNERPGHIVATGKPDREVIRKRFER